MKLPDEILKVVERLICSRIHLTRRELDCAYAEEYEGMIDEQSLVPSDRHIACCSRFLEMCKGRDIDMDAVKIVFRRLERRVMGDRANNQSVRTESFVSLVVTKSDFTFIKRKIVEEEKCYCPSEEYPDECPCIDIQEKVVEDRYAFNGNSWLGETESVLKGCSNYAKSSNRPYVVKSVKEFDLTAVTSCCVDMFWAVNCYDKKGNRIRDYNSLEDFESSEGLTSNEQIDDDDELP